MAESKERIEKKVVKKVTPTAHQRARLQKTIQQLRKEITAHLQSVPYPVTLELVGSTAKDTYLAHALDIDFFLVFPPETPQKILETTALTVGRDILQNTEECYAEHPYIRGTFNTYQTEIVPCYNMTKTQEKITAVDRTPLHTTYIIRNLEEIQKAHVRLFKQFLKGINCYGAEAEIQGFSGYLCELLILKYNTFQNLITQAALWNSQIILTLQSTHHPRFHTPLAFIDPVDSKRNVASALVEHKYNFFVKACNAYLKTPRYTFFFPNKLTPWTQQKIRNTIQNDNYIGIRFKKPDIISENLYPQIRKAQRAISDLCSRHEFTILNTTFTVQENYVFIILKIKQKRLHSTTLHEGPPVRLKKNSLDFQKKWMDDPQTIDKPIIKNNRWYVTKKREYTSIATLLRQQLPQLSIGKDIQQIVKKHGILLSKKQLLTPDLQPFWTEYLDSRMPWER